MDIKMIYKMMVRTHGEEVAQAIIVRLLADDCIDENLDLEDVNDMFWVADTCSDEMLLVKELSNGKYLMMI